MNEIRTNFAIYGLLTSGLESRTETKDATYCATHPLREISLFCAHCSVFICPDCFETGTAVHATHARVSLQEGLNRIKSEISGLLETVTAIEDRTSEATVEESKVYDDACGKLRATGLAAIDHYNSTVAQLKTELDQVLLTLTTYMDHLGVPLAQIKEKRRIIESVRGALSGGSDTRSASVYIQRRAAVRHAVHALNDFESMSDSFGTISIQGDGNQNRQDRSPAVIPSVQMMDVASKGLYQIHHPFIRRDQTGQSENVITRLHRSTSNDQLNS